VGADIVPSKSATSCFKASLPLLSRGVQGALRTLPSSKHLPCNCPSDNRACIVSQEITHGCSSGGVEGVEKEASGSWTSFCATNTSLPPVIKEEVPDDAPSDCVLARGRDTCILGCGPAETDS